MQSLGAKSSRPKSFETEMRPSRPRLQKTGLETRLETETKSRDSITDNIIYQSWGSYVQIQCTIAFDAQTEGKVSVTRKSWLYAIICRASLWSATAIGTKEYTWPTNWWIIFMYFLEYWLKNVLFRYLVNPMQNQARSTKWHSAINRSIGHPCSGDSRMKKVGGPMRGQGKSRGET